MNWIKRYDKIKQGGIFITETNINVIKNPLVSMVDNDDSTKDEIKVRVHFPHHYPEQYAEKEVQSITEILLEELIRQLHIK